MNTKIYAIGLLFMAFTSTYAQKLSEIETLTYSKMIDKEEGKKYKTGMDIKTYTASDKNTYKQGDTLVLGNPTGTEQSGFSSKPVFRYLFYGKPAATLLKGMRYIEAQYQDYKVTIEKIQFNKGSMGMENYVFFYVKPLPGSKFTLLDEYITVTMVDNAITKGEIKPLRSDRPLTRDEAIELLKKKKEEMDLGIITKEEFEALKGWVGCGMAIDFNQNGNFEDSGEKLFMPDYIGNSPQTYSGSFTIPSSVSPGNYRMRIWNREANSGPGNPSQSACGTYGYGTWVDYTVNITPVLSTSEASISKAKIYPNPVSDILNIEDAQVIKSIEIYDFNGNLLRNDSSLNKKSISIKLSNLTPGAYTAKITNTKGVQIFKFIKK